MPPILHLERDLDTKRVTHINYKHQTVNENSYLQQVEATKEQVKELVQAKYYEVDEVILKLSNELC